MSCKTHLLQHPIEIDMLVKNTKYNVDENTISIHKTSLSKMREFFPFQETNQSTNAESRLNKPSRYYSKLK
jgi:hypothetical protein